MEKDVLEPRCSLKFRKNRTIIYALSAMILSIFNVLGADTISIGGMTPDFLVVLVVIISMIEGQFYGTVAAFCIGLFFDIVSFDLIGTNALAKTVVGFFAGYFSRPGFVRQDIGSIKFIFILFISSIINNLLYYIFFIKPMEMTFVDFFFRYGIAMAFYTTIFGIFAMIIANRKQKE